MYKLQKLILVCIYNKNCFKCDVNMDFVGFIDRSEDSDDSDDVIEFQFFYYDLDFDLNLVFVNIY